MAVDHGNHRMDRFETRVDTEGVFAVEGREGWLKIGDFDAIVEELGEVYEIEYDEDEQSVPWLETDPDGKLRIEVRETLEEISFNGEFVDLISSTPPEDRVEFFTDMIRRIWDSKGQLEEF